MRYQFQISHRVRIFPHSCPYNRLRSSRRAFYGLRGSTLRESRYCTAHPSLILLTLPQLSGGQTFSVMFFATPLIMRTPPHISIVPVNTRISYIRVNVFQTGTFATGSNKWHELARMRTAYRPWSISLVSRARARLVPPRLSHGVKFNNNARDSRGKRRHAVLPKIGTRFSLSLSKKKKKNKFGVTSPAIRK